MSVKTKQIIYELEDEEQESPKKANKQINKSNILVRKLGLVTYVKWSNVYNYHFTFELSKGRLLCYKTANSKNPNNYYALIQGHFVESEEEIAKWERIFQKKKNYIPPPSTDDPKRSAIYVRTKKGKTFRLVTNEGESHDKIMGYLQMCFDSKISSESKSFFAMLGLGVIKVQNRGYRLNTGILVPLDNWSVINSPQNYLKSPDLRNDADFASRIGQLVSNIAVIGALISAFETSTMSLIFNPMTQTVDVILFDTMHQPSQFLYEIFQLVKKSKKQSIASNALQQQSSQLNQNQSQLGQLMKLHTFVQVANEKGEYVQVAENKAVQIYCKKCYLPIITNTGSLQESMFSSSIADEHMEEEDIEMERFLVSQALNFYKKALSYYPASKSDLQEDTKEFIMVNTFKLAVVENSPEPQLVGNDNDIPFDLQTQGEYSVSEEEPEARQSEPIIQQTKAIPVQMRRMRSLVPYSPSPDKQFEEVSPPYAYENGSEDQQQVVVQDFQIEPVKAPPPQFEQVPLEPQESPENQQDEVDEDDFGGDDNEEAAIAKAGAKDSFPTQTIKGYKNIVRYATEFKWLPQKDEYRVEKAHKSGGTACIDKGIVNLSRSVGKTMIKEIGRKIISGNFNLTTVSFPIKAMIPKSALEKSFMQTILFPLYLNRAALTQDPAERMKLVMIATVCNYIQANTFLKPLNPIIGETFEGSYDDGTQLYAEQISHHPPVSYFLVCGPQKSYRFWGYYLYEAKAGLNSLVLANKGKRFIEFIDGQRITYDFNHECYSGTFMGTMKHESTGTLTFRDDRNGLVGVMNFGKVKKKPTDYVDGEIKQGTRVVSKLYGSYLGFLNWDNNRYWDCRHVLPFKLRVDASQIESDHTRRQDRLLMMKGNMVEAQKMKETLEGLQRSDTKLRKEYEKQKQAQAKKKK